MKNNERKMKNRRIEIIVVDLDEICGKNIGQQRPIKSPHWKAP